MQAELDREQAQLLLPGMQRPYFIEYRLDDFATYEAVANYGALVQRAVRPPAGRARHRAHRQTTPPTPAAAAAMASLALAPTDNNPEAIRYASGPRPTRPTRTLCAPTPTKQAALKRFESPAHREGLCPRQAGRAYRPAGLARHRPRGMEAPHRGGQRPLRLRPRGQRASPPTCSTPPPTCARLAVNRYLVNTEGTVVREGYTGYSRQHQRGRPGARRHATHPRERHRRRHREGTGSLARLPPARHRQPQEPAGPAQCARRLGRGLPRAGPVQRRRGRRRDGLALRPQRRGQPPRDGHHRPHPGRVHLQLPRPRAAGLPQRHRRSAHHHLRRPRAARRLRRGR